MVLRPSYVVTQLFCLYLVHISFAIQAGDVLIITEKKTDGWWCGYVQTTVSATREEARCDTLEGNSNFDHMDTAMSPKIGTFPSNYIELIDKDAFTQFIKEAADNKD